MYLLIPFISAIIFFQDDFKWRTVKTSDDLSTFQFELPENFISMSETDSRQKYESYRKSIAQFTTYDRQTDFGINRSFSKFASDDIDLLSQFFKASIMNLYSEVNFIREEITEINGRKFAVFEFESTVRDTNKSFRTEKAISKYVYVQYTLIEENTIVFNFQTPLAFKDAYRETATRIMESVKIR
jgi:hypothetical protein